MFKIEIDGIDDEEDSVLISAISILDNSRWGAREKRKERHRSKELLTPKKGPSCDEKEGKPSESCEKSTSSSPLSSSLAGSSELDVWSPIQKHYEEDIVHLLSNRTPSQKRNNIGFSKSINILDTASNDEKPRLKLVHQIRSDGVLEVARRASSESMSSIFQSNDAQNTHSAKSLPRDQSRTYSLASFTAVNPEQGSSSASKGIADETKDNDNNEPSKFGGQRGHKRGLSIKGSCRRQWLRNQSKIEKTKRKADIMKDSIPVPEDSEVVERGVGESDVVADDVRIKKKDTDNDLRLDRDTSQERIKSMSESKSSPQNQGSTTVKTTVEF